MVKGVEITVSTQGSPVVGIAVDGLSACLVQRPMDVHVTLELQSFRIDDIYRSTAIGLPDCRLVDSSPRPYMDTQVASSRLLYFDMVHTEPGSPIASDQILAQNKIMLVLGALSVSLHLGTIARLVELGKITAGESKPTPLQAPPSNEILPLDVPPAEEIERSSSSSAPVTLLDVTVTAGQLCVELTPEVSVLTPKRGCVATLLLSGVDIVVKSDPNEVKKIVMEVTSFDI
eukprot:COSAG05_NODE_6291_length_985_cov_1.399549_2_plen_230_part_01